MTWVVFHHVCPSCGRGDLPMIHTAPGMVRCGSCRFTCPAGDVRAVRTAVAETRHGKETP